MAMGRDGPHSCPGRERACMRVCSMNVNGLSSLGKRKELVECFKSEKVEHYRDTRNPYKRMWSDGLYENEYREREGSVGGNGRRSGMVWSGRRKKRKGKGRMCTPNVS